MKKEWSLPVASPYLSLILPAYNESRSIRRTLQLTQSYLDRQPYDYELIVAADGNDGTRELVTELARQDRRIRVLGSPQRSGKGRGIRLGVAQARGQVIGFADADYKREAYSEIDYVSTSFGSLAR